mgnify:CR=1 FL=1
MCVMFFCVFAFVLLTPPPSPFLLCRCALFMHRNPIEVYTVTADYMFLTFTKGGFMDSELMDHIIRFWKNDESMNVVYRSGERVLLSPLFITVFLFFLIFFLLE